MRDACLDDPGWAREKTLDSVEGRREAEAELEQRIGEWTSAREREEVVATLWAAGVHVAPVNEMRDVFDDPQLVHRRAFRRLEHPVMGSHSVPEHRLRVRVTSVVWGGTSFAGQIIARHVDAVSEFNPFTSSSSPPA